MRPQQAARAVWRTATSSGSRSRLLASSEIVVSPTASSRAAVASASVSSALLPRSFSTSSTIMKKKNKKVSVSEMEDEFEADEEDLFISGDDEGISDGSIAPGSATSSRPSASQIPQLPVQAGVRPGIAKLAAEWRSMLEWEVLDKGSRPSLHAWRHMAGHAHSQEEFDLLLELARVYRDRVGSLGEEAGERLASRASAINLPEIALNAYMDRYFNGLECTVESLYLLLRSLSQKVSRGVTDVIKASAQTPGAPAHQVDLFGASISPAASEPNEETAEGEKTPKAGSKEMGLPLSREKMTIIDRMSMAASLTPSLTPTKSHDPILLAFLPAALINTYALKRPIGANNPDLDGVRARTNVLISLLVSVIDQSLMDGLPTVFLQKNDSSVLPPKRAKWLAFQLTSTLRYIALQPKSVEFRHPVSGKKLDPVRSVYRYMDHVAPDHIEQTVKIVEPLLHAQASTQHQTL